MIRLGRAGGHWLCDVGCQWICDGYSGEQQPMGAHGLGNGPGKLPLPAEDAEPSVEVGSAASCHHSSFLLHVKSLDGSRRHLYVVMKLYHERVPALALLKIDFFRLHAIPFL